MSAANQCIIEEFLIHSDRRKEGEKPFDLAPFIVAVDYFEDIESLNSQDFLAVQASYQLTDYHWQ